MADEQQEGVRSGNVWGMGGGEIIFKFKECRQMVNFIDGREMRRWGDNPKPRGGRGI